MAGGNRYSECQHVIDLKGVCHLPVLVPVLARCMLASELPGLSTLFAILVHCSGERCPILANYRLPVGLVSILGALATLP